MFQIAIIDDEIIHFSYKSYFLRSFTSKYLSPTYLKNSVYRIGRRRISDKRCADLYKYYSLPIEDKTVFYDAFSGLGILDSPRTLFKAMLKRDEFKDKTIVALFPDTGERYLSTELWQF